MIFVNIPLTAGSLVALEVSLELLCPAQAFTKKLYENGS
jgi:hypothetical protein